MTVRLATKSELKRHGRWEMMVDSNEPDIVIVLRAATYLIRSHEEETVANLSHEALHQALMARRAPVITHRLLDKMTKNAQVHQAPLDRDGISPEGC